MSTEKAPKRTKPNDCHSGPEDAFQVSAIGLVRTLIATQGIDKEAAMHPPNGGKRSIGVARKLKAQGVTRGYPDIMTYAAEDVKALATRDGWGDRKVGLALELKIWPNKPSPDQENIHFILRKAGWRVNVCYGLKEVEDHVRRYFNIK